MRVTSSNGTWFRKSTIILSTVKLPMNYGYESCLFTGAESEVLDRYDTMIDAVWGHERLRKRYGLR